MGIIYWRVDEIINRIHQPECLAHNRYSKKRSSKKKLKKKKEKK